MSKETADVLFETLDALDKHTSRLNGLDKKTKEHSDKLTLIVKDLEKQIESSSKDVLRDLIENNTKDTESLVKAITTVIAENIGKLTINAPGISVNVETDSIAKAIGSLALKNTNNVNVDISELTKTQKNLSDALVNLNTNLYNNFTAMKVVMQEVVNKEISVTMPQAPKVKEPQAIVGMNVKRDKDNLIESIEFLRSK